MWASPCTAQRPPLPLVWSESHGRPRTQPGIAVVALRPFLSIILPQRPSLSVQLRLAACLHVCSCPGLSGGARNQVQSWDSCVLRLEGSCGKAAGQPKLVSLCVVSLRSGHPCSGGPWRVKGCKQHAGARRWVLEGAASLRIDWMRLNRLKHCDAGWP